MTIGQNNKRFHLLQLKYRVNPSNYDFFTEVTELLLWCLKKCINMWKRKREREYNLCFSNIFAEIQRSGQAALSQGSFGKECIKSGTRWVSSCTWFDAIYISGE